MISDLRERQNKRAKVLTEERQRRRRLVSEGRERCQTVRGV
jgi:hypothetical protein